MDRWEIALLILIAIISAMGSQLWMSWLDHQRRSKALDVIKAAFEAGKEPPAQVYEMLEANAYASMGFSKRPWAEAMIFGAVAVGLWIMFAVKGGDNLVLIAAVMSAMSAGCFLLAIFAPGQKLNDDGR